MDDINSLSLPSNEEEDEAGSDLSDVEDSGYCKEDYYGKDIALRLKHVSEQRIKDLYNTDKVCGSEDKDR